MKFSYKNSLVSDKLVRRSFGKLKDEIRRMNSASRKKYEDDRASINLSVDGKMLKVVKRVIAEKKKLKPEYVVVVGIGGSNLGTIAVQEAVLGKLYNHHAKTKVLYCDTVDSDSLQEIIHTISSVLKRGGNVLINGVSKSGETTETIANFEILVGVLKKYRKEFAKYVVVTSDKDSRFWDLAKGKGFTVLEIPEKVGGRYSVFSPVGLFPLGLIGVDINGLLKGARAARKRGLSGKMKDNYSALSAAVQYLNYKKKRDISDTFLFANDLEAIGMWYRQLMGESVGKEFNINKRKVYNGMTPTVSIGSVDLHSMAQLYLGGPHDKITSFVYVKKNKFRIRVPRMKEYDELVEGIQGKSVDEIMRAIYDGVKIAFVKGKRSFMEIELKDKSAYSFGEFLQFKMMEMMFLGFLMNVNPFNQPNVEEYKIETKKILEEK